MNSSKRLNIALIGAGMVMPSYVTAINRLNNIHVHSIVDIDIKKAKQLARKCRAKTIVTSSIEDILFCNDIDAFIIATPHHTHSRLLEVTIPTGKHILIEKPVVLSRKELNAALDSSSSKYKNQIIAVSHQMRFREPLLQIKQLLDNGELGELLNIHLQLSCKRDINYFRDSGWRGSWKTEGGSLAMNSGLHLFDTVLWLIGNTPKKVYGVWSSHISPIETDDRIAGLAVFDKDVYVTVNMSSETKELFRPTISITTKKAIIIIELGFYQKILECLAPSNIVDTLKRSEKKDLNRRNGYDCHPAELSHLELVDYFTKACLGGSKKRLVSLEDAFRAVDFVKMFYEYDKQN